MKGIIFTVFFIALTGYAYCGLIPKNVGVRSPVGKCPSVDGQIPVYLPDSEQCNVFYECSHGEPVPKQCEFAGLCFDPNINACDWPKPDEPDFLPRTPVGNCPPRDGNETVFLPDNSDCSIYYMCSNGRAINLTCPGNMEFSPSQKVCVDPIDSDCKASSNDEEVPIQPRNAVGKCPPVDPSNPVYLPDDQDCTLYYECSNGQPVQNNCPPGEEWNPDINTCTPPSISNCKAPGHATTTTVAFTTTQKSEEISVRKPVGTCPVTDPTGTSVYLPDSEDCTIYYECSNGTPIQNVCPPNEYWDQTLKTCQNDVPSGCKPSTTDSSLSL